MFTQSTCCACGRKAFPIESVAVNSKTYHKACFLCSTCKISLSPSNHHLVAGKLFCQVHRPTAVTSTTAAIRSSPADTRSVASTATTPPVLGPAETVTYKTSTATVNISTLQTPWSVLGVTPGTPIKQLKDAFYKLINVESRQTRAIVSLSYYILLNVDLPSSKFSVSGCQAICRDTGDIWFLCAIGHTAKLREKLTQNPKQLLATDGHGCTLLYVAARGGFYDTTEMLLKLKAHVNTTQHTKSSALHCAAYYGHEPVVELLLSYGIQDTINTFGNTAAAEARTQRIKCLITKYNVDASAQTIASITRGISNCISHVAHKGEVVGLSLRVANTIEKMKWKTAWHGTKMKYTASILQNGLVASGDKLPNGKAVKPPSNHFALNTRINGIDNWAHAIFVSPSIIYACHLCYSERVMYNDTKWCVVIESRVEPGAYSTASSTTSPVASLPGEPEDPEWRVEPSGNEEHDILRVSDKRHVQVVALLLVKVDFLGKVGDLHFTHPQLVELFSSH